MHILYKEHCESTIPPQIPVKETSIARYFVQTITCHSSTPKTTNVDNVLSIYKQLSGEEKAAFQEDMMSILQGKLPLRKQNWLTKKGWFLKTILYLLRLICRVFFKFQAVHTPWCTTVANYVSTTFVFIKLHHQMTHFCYCCSEVKGRQGSNDIGTCLYEWLCQLPDTITEVLFSDTCGGLNRKPKRSCNVSVCC